ncbi:MAG: hypothetical protein OER86_02675 [Phycisphaerae bacterium]|nr:hypothetical protein [Phycisphaerae bacterium]
MPNGRSFVGFGFGPIQSGLFLLEAFRSGNFQNLTVAEIDPGLVHALRSAGGSFQVNVATREGLDTVEVHGVQVLDPTDSADQPKLIEAISQAHEMATALPSVETYDTGGPASVARLIAEGIRRRPSQPRLIYAAENHRRAARCLHEAIARHLPPAELDSAQVVDTVIGKMSGLVTDPDQLRRWELAPMTPGATSAILVEAFNHILISRVTLAHLAPGIPAFQQKTNLLPFEDAKLFGHNAVHALIGYLAHAQGIRCMSELASQPGILDIARRALLDESGAALIARHGRTGDPLFTPAGFAEHADDLLERMLNPYLRDQVERIIRDTQRKLAYDDRLIGTMRLALEEGIEPRNLASGAAAAARHLLNSADSPGEQAIRDRLIGLWGNRIDAHAPLIIELICNAKDRLPEIRNA